MKGFQLPRKKSKGRNDYFYVKKGEQRMRKAFAEKITLELILKASVDFIVFQKEREGHINELGVAKLQGRFQGVWYRHVWMHRMN